MKEAHVVASVLQHIMLFYTPALRSIWKNKILQSLM